MEWHQVQPFRQAIAIAGVDNPPTGLVNTTVLRLRDATQVIGSPPWANWFARTDDADDGTTIAIRQRGIYAVSFGVLHLPGGSLLAGCSIDAPAPALVLNPDSAANWAIGYVDLQIGMPVGQIRAFKSGGTFAVTQAQADDPAQGLLRVQASDVADGPPSIFAMNPDTAVFRLYRVADCNG